MLDHDHIIDLLGSHTLPFERAALLALAETMPIDTSAASTVWDPWTCAADLLPQLARALSVDLWDDAWPELKKRSVIFNSPELHDLKTTIEGYQRYLEIVDCRLVDYIQPPKCFVAGAVQSEDERRAWLRGLPELRLYFGAEPLPFDGGLTADLNWVDLSPALDDRGRVMAARKARLYDPKTDTLTPIGPVDFDRIDDGETTVELEQISLPAAYDPAALWADLTFFDIGHAIPLDPAQVPVFTWRTDTRGRQGPVSLLDALPYGFSAVDVASVRVPVRQLMGYAFFADVSAADVAYIGEESADLGFYDVFKIARVGEKSGTPLMDAGGYADIDYVDWPTHTLHLLVDAAGPSDGLAAFYAGISHADEGCAIDDDLRRFDQAVRASYVASGPSSDHVTLSAEITRFLALSDGIPLDGSFHFGKRIAREHA